MTADEIRDIELYARDSQSCITGNVQDCALFLREIAAQMAEANQHIKVIAEALYADGMAKNG